MQRLFIILHILLFSFSVFAQKSDTASKENSHQIDEVVISGTLQEIRKSQSATPIEIFNNSFFKKNPTPSLYESMQMVNGVVPVISCNVCNTGSISINGLDGPYTMVVIDGMPIVSALSTVYGLMGIPNSMIDRIEVIKGSASTIYGSDALAGVINIITVKPEKAPKLSIDLMATGYQEFQGDIGTTFSFGKSTSMLGINYYQMQHKWDENGDNFTDIALVNRFSIFNSWSFKRKNKLSNKMAFRFLNENRNGGEMQWNNNYKGSDLIYGETIQTNRAEWIGNYDFAKLSNTRLMYSYNLHQQKSYYGTTRYDALQHTAFAQLVWNKSIAKVDWLAGITQRYTYYDDNTPATMTMNNNKPSNQYIPGVFAQATWNPNIKNSLLAGLRLDYFNLHGVIPSPRVAYKYLITENKTIRFSGGTGFRVVNLFTEEHAALTGARSVVITESLNPEQSYSGNINYTQYIPIAKGYLNVDASIFYTYFTNKILADYDTDPNQIIYDNLDGNAISRGISLSLDYTYSKNLKINIGGSIIDATQTNAKVTEDLYYAPKWMGTFQVTYINIKYDFTIDYTGQVYGPMRLPILPNDYRPEYSPVYTLQNVQFSKSFHNGLGLYAGIKNIFNFMPISPIMRPQDPFDRQANDVINNPLGYTFDAAYNYAPLMGIRGFVGIRYMLK
jgi:outer membrane receptor for ferrienterochelin and colicins